MSATRRGSRRSTAATSSAKTVEKTPASAAGSIDSVMQETRWIKPDKGGPKHGSIPTAAKLKSMRSKALKDPEGFWEERANELEWFSPWTKVLDWKYPRAKWFTGGKLNVAHNCIDRHLTTWRRNKAAIVWEGEPGDVRTLTYQQLHREVCRCANGLKKLGVKRGDVVAIYMGMIPEAAIAMLACARIGATHNVVFGGFSADALRERIIDSNAVCVITQDAAWRRGSHVMLKEAVDAAVKGLKHVANVLVVRRVGVDITMKKGRDHWWDETLDGMSDSCTAAKLPAEHPLFILYTSGSTGKPKGILHTTGGYLTQATYTSKIVFDLQEDDLYFCTADVGWITGHSYIVYGPLSNGASIFMYEGAPNHPGPDRFWSMIARHRISIFYTAPTAIRAFMKWGDQHPAGHDLSSLRILGTVGEPINPEAWMWYYKHIGGGRCPIVDTWWQTETGSIMISPVPNVTPMKPGTATMPLPGIDADVVRRDGTRCKADEGGYLVVKHPWPSMLRNVYGDFQRYKKTYWSEYPPKGDRPAYYFTGDGARRDADGYIWIMGRVDDVVNVSGHRLGTAEIESALVSHARVAEAAVVARPDEIKGNALVAYVTLRGASGKMSGRALEKLAAELRAHVAAEIGHIAKPDDIRFSEALPKTRSGKIMRRLLRELAAGGTISGDTSTLEDFSVLENLREDED